MTEPTISDLAAVDLLKRYHIGRRVVLPDCLEVRDREALLVAIVWPDTGTGGGLEPEPPTNAPPLSGEKYPTNRVGNGNEFPWAKFVFDFSETE